MGGYGNPSLPKEGFPRGDLQTISRDEALRAFVAVELPSEVRTVLRDIVQALGELRLRGLRLVDPEGVHFTLKFLGEVPRSRLVELVRAMDQAASPFAPFPVELRGVGVFPSLGSPRVLWVGVGEGTDPLRGLAQAVEAALEPLGFPPEERAFTPHLTLARVRMETPPEERRRAGEGLRRLEGRERAQFTAEGISLMQSTLRREGALYTRLHYAPFPSGPLQSP